MMWFSAALWLTLVASVPAFAAEITVWHTWRGTELQSLEQLAKAFGEETGTAVRLVDVPFGAFDSKGPDYAFLRDQVLARGCAVLALNTGVLGGTDLFPVDIEADEVARAGGGDLAQLRRAGDRGAAMAVMARGAAAVAGVSSCPWLRLRCVSNSSFASSLIVSSDPLTLMPASSSCESSLSTGTFSTSANCATVTSAIL